MFKTAQNQPKIRPQFLWVFLGVAVVTVVFHSYAKSIGSRGIAPSYVVHASYEEIPCSRCHGDANLKAHCPLCGGKGVLKVASSRLHNTNSTRRINP